MRPLAVEFAMNTSRQGKSSDALPRRTILRHALVAGAALVGVDLSRGLAQPVGRPTTPATRRVPLIDTTDLYHPPQDVGDNFDILAAYALPEVDLQAVILDATEKYRREGRDAGFIPVLQLNSIFGRRVPCATTPYAAMQSPEDKLLDAPDFQQAGVELLLETLRQSAEQVEVTVFGSARAVAVAYNREPDLLRQRVRRIHLCAGASSPDFLEWNVVLDPHAMVRLLRRANGSHRIVPAAEVLSTDKVLPNELRPCIVQVRDNGGFSFTLTDRPTNFLIYDRGDPKENERALQEALSALYLSFRPHP